MRGGGGRGGDGHDTLSGGGSFDDDYESAKHEGEQLTSKVLFALKTRSCAMHVINFDS